jgi:hypothetical protein
MRSILGALSLVVVATGVANAQTADDMRIVVGGFHLVTNGAEKAAGVSRAVNLGPASIGKPSAAVFSMFGCGNFSVSVPPSAFADDAHAGWRVEITPTRVADRAVTFRLRWVRALDTGNAFTPASEDLDLTLTQGESRTLDSVVVPATSKTRDSRPCNVKTASLRVSVDLDSFDRRLIGADVWLVERLVNGKEESQLQTVRGLPHRAVPFYFDSISDGTNRLDVFGRLVTQPQRDGIEIDVEAVRARAHPGQQGYQAARWFRSTIQVKPGEIVEVALTPDGEPGSELANRVLSLRIRAKQIR